MNSIKQKLVSTLLKTLLDNVDAGNCNLTDEMATEAINALTALNKNVYNITRRKACDQILHCSIATFELYRTMNLIPEGKHDYGSKEMRWCENDFKDAIAYRRKSNTKVID